MFCLIALLMASRVPHFSGKSLGRVPREHLAVVLVAVAAALLLLFDFPMQTLVAVTLAYLASIPLAIRRYRAFETRRHGGRVEGREAAGACSLTNRLEIKR